MRSVSLCSLAAVVACAVPGISVANADIVPVSRDTTIDAHWALLAFPGGGGHQADGTTTFDPFSNTVTTLLNGAASQTSSITLTGASASVSATGYDNGSVMQHQYGGGTSTFTYVFDLTAASSLTIAGSVTRSSWATGFGTVTLYDDASNAVLFQVPTGPVPMDVLTTSFSTIFSAAPGRYRFVVSAMNNGNGTMPFTHTSSAQATLSVPTPAAASLLAVAALAGARRKRV